MQSSCFLANSRLRMTTTSFLTAASVMRCLCCCAPLSWVGADQCGELGPVRFPIPARRDSVELVEANSTAPTNSTENPATGLITHRHAPHSTHPYWHVPSSSGDVVTVSPMVPQPSHPPVRTMPLRTNLIMLDNPSNAAAEDGGSGLGSKMIQT